MKGAKNCLLLWILVMLLCACGRIEGEKQYTASFLDLFDTVTFVTGMARSEDDFQARVQKVYDELRFYHRLFDIYNDYEGMNNLKTVNDDAGLAPVRVDGAIIELLNDCRAICDLTGGKVNAAMGSMLSLWSAARQAGLDHPENAELPDEAALRHAAEHGDFDAIIIDAENSTVFISDAELQLDVGAIAKGWAVERVARNAPEGLLISVGGNVRAVGDKDGAPWVIGIQNPDGGDYLHTLHISNQSVVTSGDYQRYYAVDGVRYAHIIDPDTLYPARLWRCVTVVCPDSGLADALSTALFLLPKSEGEALLRAANACAMWVDAAGVRTYSASFEDLIIT